MGSQQTGTKYFLFSSVPAVTLWVAHPCEIHLTFPSLNFFNCKVDNSNTSLWGLWGLQVITWKWFREPFQEILATFVFFREAIISCKNRVTQMLILQLSSIWTCRLTYQAEQPNSEGRRIVAIFYIHGVKRSWLLRFFISPTFICD